MGSNNKDQRDNYYRLAKKNGYRARSAYKLIHIDQHYNIISSSQNIVDLCSAPGGWSQVLSERIKDGLIISVDLQMIHPISNVTFIQDDITTDSCKERILLLAPSKIDLILCDGAPDVTGIHDLDEYFQTELLLNALSITQKIARKNATFVGKMFRSEDTGYLLRHFQKFFCKVELCKPKSSRGASIECFIVCREFKDGVESLDPFNVDFDGVPICMELVICGEGPCADLSSFLEDKCSVKSKPIGAPYENIIEMRKGNYNANKK